MLKVKLTDALTTVQEDSVPAESRRKITAEWTGRYPCLCSGEWIISIDGEKVDLPEDIKSSEMGTYGVYSRWHFASYWEEVWEDYEDGLFCDEWIKANSWWISDLHLSNTETVDLYNAVAACDWRHGSCGGCI